MPGKPLLILRVIIVFLIGQPLVFTESLASQIAEKKFVRLLFPLERGTELDILAKYVSDPKLYSIDRNTFVLAAEVSNAVIAFKLGKSIQAKTKIPFVLSYDPGHPQADLRWMQTEITSKPVNSKLVDKTKRISKAIIPRLSPINISAQPIRALHAANTIAVNNKTSIIASSRKCVPLSNCLPTMRITSPWQPDQAEKNISISPGNFDLAVTPVANQKTSKFISSNSKSVEAGQVLMPKNRSNYTPTDISAKPKSLLTSTDKLKLLPTMTRTSSSLFDQSIVTLSQVSSFSFSDPRLVYVFVPVSDTGQLASLIKSINPQAFYQIDRNLYVQVAVYNSSRVGKQVLDSRLSTLVERGFNPVALSPGQILGMASSIG